MDAARFPLPGTGKQKIKFIKTGETTPPNSEFLRLPCGQCIGCRLDRSRQWATRCMHEARNHERNSFITLTYADEYLPLDGSLCKSHFQEFIKRLRHEKSEPIKYFHCGEYGSPENSQRPHYHAIVFNYEPKDLEYYKTSNGNNLYSSERLTQIWGKGYAVVGEVTWESAAYVARYCVKKINGPEAEKHDPVTGLRPYDRVHPFTGEVNEVLPEYATMSNGIGKAHFYRYMSDIYPHDEVIINGHTQRPPRYYDDLYDSINPAMMETIRQERTQKMNKHAADNTRSRLKQRQTVKTKQATFLKRNEV